MYESGASKTARILIIIMGVLLGLLFILSGCCQKANAADLEMIAETSEGVQHHFF